MSFWNSQMVKARKPHTCLYCSKSIEIGEEYSRESGTYEGEFQHYCLCERCRFVVDKFENDEYLSDFYETVSNNDLLRCPSCGSTHLREWDYSKDKMSCECECDECNEKWTADLTIEGIKEIISVTS